MRENEKMSMLMDINIVDFVLVELTQFLDTHPTDKDAINHLNFYLKIKQKLMKDFSEQYYPLSKDYAYSENEWSWGKAPLPWEGWC